ncbi:multiple sugar transport system substrate-binding protein [Microbacteriaceae bacterium SG_E_30_P1]|uniref:Multiple sugar transport system substrate-binding protein n=1 Tax=Antiquaquibacter oligotrophicus TaxID=2880260 RepID=A0ABT6KR35_9MICO|nr:extracellular solute-binding protein [Antiquaquibacter oligotrophicus]MDH6181659.1 multiple sugar transport system substrate-binding protein [Antiquaquibacter oligotrophicus]UDF12657.1 extracellular solute-binding protein [Antiquaquibacter oligotrophicus]
MFVSTRSRSRTVAAIGLLIATSAVLAACGRADSTPEATRAAVDDEPATGVVDVWAPSGDANYLDTLLEGFRDDNPDATVNVTVIPVNEYVQKIQAAIASDTLPDVALVKADGTLLSGTWSAVPDGLVELEDFFPGTLALGQIDGVQYLVPWYNNVRVLLYRSDFAEKAGVEAPTTWDEWVPFLEGLREGGAAQPFGSDVSWGTDTGLFVSTLAKSAGAELVSEDGTEWQVDTPEMHAAFEQYQALFADGLTSPDGPTFLDQVSSFTSGQIGSLVTGPWVLAQFNEAVGEEWMQDNLGVAMLPAGPAGSVGMLVGGGWTVSDSSDNPDAAWKVIRYLGQVDTELQQYEGFGSLPPRTTAWEEADLTDDAYLEPFFEQMETASASPAIATWDQFTKMLGGQAEKMIRGGVSIDDVLAEGQSLADSIGTGR